LSDTVPGTDRKPVLDGLHDVGPSSWKTTAVFVAGDAVGGLCLLGVGFLMAREMALGVAGSEALALVLLPIVLLGLLGLSGFYRPRFVHPALEMKQMAVVVGMMTGAAVTTLVAVGRDPGEVLLVAAVGGAGTVVLPLFRAVARVVGARFSWWGLPTVVLGSGESAEQVLNTLKTWPEIGLRPVAWLAEPESSTTEPVDPVDGRPSWAPRLAQVFNIPYLVTTMPDQSHAAEAKRLAHYAKFFDHVFTVPEVESPALWATGHPGDGLCGRGVCNAASSPVVRALRRAIDLLGAGLALLLLAPVFAVTAVLIRLDSEGPVFYRQERLGANGQIFTLLKFRSMYCNAEERLEEVLNNDPDRRREYEQYHKLEDDPRVTPMGRVLRRYSLDELPQLLNVLRGEMSLVGPRAYLPSELPDMNGLESVILQTPPGVTGLWQVSGRNDRTFKERVDLDVHYVQNWSVWLDLYLLVRTVPTVVTGEGAA